MNSRTLAFGRLCAGLAAAALLGAGCASANLSDNAKIASEVMVGLPVGTPAPSLVARAIWFPKANGHNSVDASPLGHMSGVLALAGDKLWFLVWNDALQAYDTQQSISLIRAANVSVVHYGSSVMLVVESWNMSFDSFELMDASRLASDEKTTEAFYRAIQAFRAKNPPPAF